MRRLEIIDVTQRQSADAQGPRTDAATERGCAATEHARAEPERGPTETDPQRADAEQRRTEEIAGAAFAGARIEEIAAYLELDVETVRERYGRVIAKAYAKRAISLRQALTKAAVQGNVQALKRLTDMERKAALNAGKRKK